MLRLFASSHISLRNVCTAFSHQPPGHVESPRSSIVSVSSNQQIHLSSDLDPMNTPTLRRHAISTDSMAMSRLLVPGSAFHQQASCLPLHHGKRRVADDYCHGIALTPTASAVSTYRLQLPPVYDKTRRKWTSCCFSFDLDSSIACHISHLRQSSLIASIARERLQVCPDRFRYAFSVEQYSR